MPLDPARVADYLRRKAAAREVAVSRAALLDPDLLARAHVDYDQLAGTTRRAFIAALPLPG